MKPRWLEITKNKRKQSKPGENGGCKKVIIIIYAVCHLSTRGTGISDQSKYVFFAPKGLFRPLPLPPVPGGGFGNFLPAAAARHFMGGERAPKHPSGPAVKKKKILVRLGIPTNDL